MATCFFIDTAHNVVEYVELIHHLLPPGGLWVNLGPLLYHWADATDGGSSSDGPEGGGGGPMSIEIPLDVLLRVAQDVGFDLIKQETVCAPYMANAKSMHRTAYHAEFFAMVKRGAPIMPPPPPPPPPRQ